MNNFLPMKTFTYGNPFYGNEFKKRKLKGFKALYYKYLYLLGVLPKNKPTKKVHPSLKQELIYLDEITSQATLINKYNLETIVDLNKCASTKTDELNELINQRKVIYNKIKRCSDIDMLFELKKKCSTFTNQISIIRKELRILEKIETRSSQMNENINKIENERNGGNEKCTVAEKQPMKW